MNPRDLIDDYVQGTITPEQLAALGAALAADADLRTYFLRYCQLHTDLHLQVRSASAADRALNAISPPNPFAKSAWLRPLAFAGGLAALLIFVLRPSSPSQVTAPAVLPNEIAWLVNAQDCEWADRQPVEGGLKPGTTLTMTRGLAEIRFRSGATVVLSGPCRLELSHANGAKLLHGKIAARVPESAVGFEVQTPQGKVIDLGTEFGVSVGDGGSADVFVYEGQVDAYSPAGKKMNLTKEQGASLAGGDPVRRDANPSKELPRKIVPVPLVKPTRWHWEFREGQPGSLLDRTGHGVGFTHRLPGTGQSYPGRDPNLGIGPDGLAFATTDSDINGQLGLPTGEYFGIPLSRLGFTGTEDFEIVVDIPAIPDLRRVGQFGLYAGTASDRNIRGGLISRDKGEYRQFFTNNGDGRDRDSVFVGLSSSGDDLRVILRRSVGKYSMTVDNQTTGSASTLAIKHPAFLDAAAGLHVGVFGANTQSKESKTLLIRAVTVTVWTVEK